jgi:hypothetical protein
MRFAYIDSNGNEVPIPSVDALALRIELGAIEDNTQLFDAQSGEWGPATNHEIYHTLRRSSETDDGFIAPPPVAPPPVAPVVEEQDEPAAEAVVDAVAEPVDVAPEPVEVAEPEPEPASEPEEIDTSFGLTLAEEPEVEEAEGALDLDMSDVGDGLELADPLPGLDDAAPAGGEGALEVSGEDESSGDDELSFGGIDLAPPAEPLDDGDDAPLDLAAPSLVDDADSVPVAADGADDADAVAGTFDFGGMEGGLELEETFDPPDEETPMSFDPPAGGGEPSGGLDGGMELETPMDFGAGGFEMDSGDGLNLETPMSEFSPEDPPAWMDDAETGGEGDVLDFSSVSAESTEDVPLRDRRTPKNKPSAPRRPRKSKAGALIGVAAVVALGAGAYAAWPVISASLSGAGDDEVPAVVIPPLAAELMPEMRDASDAALAEVFEGARVSWVEAGGLEAPPADWLAGIYLAQASQYASAETFWEGMDQYLSAVRAIDLADFDAAFAAEMTARGAPATEAAAMRARADSGFVAAADAREATYSSLQALVDSALRLHQFLIANEANIEYAPASTVTTDPVLEVSPASEEIAEAMGELIDAVTGALGDLGYRDQVTAAGLRDVVLTRVQENGVQ